MFCDDVIGTNDDDNTVKGLFTSAAAAVNARGLVSNQKIKTNPWRRCESVANRGLTLTNGDTEM